nr:immunoglobulin heavy chain junction region [Homo sapiens]
SEGPIHHLQRQRQE